MLLCSLFEFCLILGGPREPIGLQNGSQMTFKKQATRFTTTGRGPEGSRGAIWEHFGGVLGVVLHGFGSRLGVDLGSYVLYILQVFAMES